jgi:hypothetical protein
LTYSPPFILDSAGVSCFLLAHTPASMPAVFSLFALKGVSFGFGMQFALNNLLKAFDN